MKPSGCDHWGSALGSDSQRGEEVVGGCDWLVPPFRQSGAEASLVVLPYAGSGPSLFRNWLNSPMDPRIETICVALPGREQRIAEPPIHDVDELLDRLMPVVAEISDRGRVAFFGYSLGATLAYALVSRLRHRNHVALFVAAADPPHLDSDESKVSGLDDGELLTHLAERHGDPLGLAADPNGEIARLFLPALRADIEVSDSYTYDSPDPLTIPVVAIGGVQDRHPTPSMLERWSELTENEFERVLLPGGHFFIREHDRMVQLAVMSRLQRLLSAIGPAGDSG